MQKVQLNCCPVHGLVHALQDLDRNRWRVVYILFVIQHRKWKQELVFSSNLKNAVEEEIRRLRGER